jgi:hypothetical protein
MNKEAKQLVSAAMIISLKKLKRIPYLEMEYVPTNLNPENKFGLRDNTGILLLNFTSKHNYFREFHAYEKKYIRCIYRP